MNALSVILLIAIAVAFVLAIRHIWRRKGSACGCSGDCSRCRRNCEK